MTEAAMITTPTPITSLDVRRFKLGANLITTFIGLLLPSQGRWTNTYLAKWYTISPLVGQERGVNVAPVRPGVAIAADDLTGALDSSAPFALRGWVARSHLSARIRTTPTAGEVDAVDCGCRYAPMGSRELACAASRLASADVAFLKIDSLLRGHPAAHVRGLRALGLWERIIVAPSFPRGGRTLENGMLRVHGELIDSSALQELDATFVLVDDLRAQPEALAGAGVMVVDATTDNDLLAIVGEQRPKTLWVGSAGLATALADRLGGGVADRHAASTGNSFRTLCVVGSMTGLAARQVVRAAETDARVRVARISAADLRSGLPASKLAMIEDALHQGATPIVTIAREDDAVEDRSLVRQLARALAGLAEHYQRLVLVGGQTAADVLRSLGVSELLVRGEFEPGVVVSTDPRERPVITRSGSFGDVDALARLLRP